MKNHKLGSGSTNVFRRAPTTDAGKSGALKHTDKPAGDTPTGEETRALQRGRDEEPAKAEIPSVTRSAHNKITGNLHTDRKTGSRGSSAALHGIELVDKPTHKPSRLKAGVTAALIGLATLGATVGTAHADPLPNPVTSSQSIDALPFKTGPPALNLALGNTSSTAFSGTSLLNTRIDQLKGVTAPTVEGQTQLAFEHFNATIERVLRLDAAGLASLQAPLGPNSSLSPDDQKQVQRALTDLVRELPVGSLSPQLVSVIKDAMVARGQSVEGLEARPLKQLGNIGGDIVKSIVDDFRHEKPATFYSVAAGAAAALGAWSYLDGSHVLTDVGIKPEVKLKFLNGHVTARAGAEWEAKLKNPTVYAGVSTTFPVGSLTGELGARVNAQGPDFGHLQATGFQLSGQLHGAFDNGGLVSFAGVGNFDGKGGLESAALSGTYLKAPWSVGAAATYIAQDSRFVSSLSVGYQPRKDFNVFVQGSHDSKGESRIGVGLRYDF